MSNTSNIFVVDCYIDAYFAGLWGNENPQYPICDNSSTGFLVTFANCPLLRVKIHIIFSGLGDRLVRIGFHYRQDGAKMSLYVEL